MVLGGGSAGGVSPTGLSILMESSVGDFDASLGSLLCRSLAVVWGSGVLPEDDQPCLGTEKANDNIPDISCLKLTMQFITRNPKIPELYISK